MPPHAVALTHPPIRPTRFPSLGTLLASSFHLSALCILAGCVLNAFSATINDRYAGVTAWGKADNDAYW